MTATALALLTYADRRQPPDVLKRLPQAIQSLEQTSYGGRVFVVDDGSTHPQHLEYLDRLERETPYAVVRRPTNGGISRAKNTCLRVLMESGAAVGLLAEDDILFQEGWEAAYLQAMLKTGIQHFSWYLPDERNETVVCNGALVTRTAELLGLFLTFTRDVVEKVGGFKILPKRYGWEHVNWTLRIINAGYAPFCADIVDSQRFLQRNTHPSTVDAAEREQCARENREAGLDTSTIYEPVVE